jgi:hypothetical protein
MPRAAPVTTATLFASFKIFSFGYFCLGSPGFQRTSGKTVPTSRDQRRLLQVSLISQRPASSISGAGSVSLEIGEKAVVGRWKIEASSFL